MTAVPTFFNWRKAVMKSDLHPYSRLVLHTIGSHMNAADEIAWPSIELLIDETGMSRSTLLKYLGVAVKAGWLTRWRRRRVGEQWAQNHYRLSIPDSVAHAHLRDVESVVHGPAGGPDAPDDAVDSGVDGELGPCDGLDDAELGAGDELDADSGGDQVREPDTNTPLTDVKNKTSLVPTDAGTTVSGESDEPDSDERYRYESEDYRQAEWIFAAILGMNPKHRKPNLEVWAQDIRLMRERDGHTHREIAVLFRWANTNTFWRQNILSPAKLRAQWDQLVIRREAAVVEAAKPATAGNTPTNAPAGSPDGMCAHVGADGKRCACSAAIRFGSLWYCRPHYREAMDADERRRSQ